MHDYIMHRSTSASPLGTDPAKRADGSRRSRALVRSSRQLWSLRSATGARSGRDAVLPLGSVWCPNSTRPAARNGSAVSPNRAIICDGYSSPVPWPSFATRERTAPTELGSRPTCKGGGGCTRQQDCMDGLGNHGSWRAIRRTEAAAGSVNTPIGEGIKT